MTVFPFFDERPSDSPLVERVWTAGSEQPGSFTSIATVHWSLVVAKAQGRASISLHGPKTGAVVDEFPPGAEWFGIEFKLGTFVPALPPGSFADGFLVPPGQSRRFFSLGHSQWEFPTFENADTFVQRLVRAGLLERDPFVDRASGLSLSPRALQYRFQRATGLSHRTIRQIERARYATALLKEGSSILDTVEEAGYSDQPHLTRSLRHFIGSTPAEIPATPIVAWNGSP